MALPVTATPTCPRCGAHNFGIKEINIQNANFRHFAIMCTACGCVVGTETMQDDERKNQLSQQIEAIANALRRHGIY